MRNAGLALSVSLSVVSLFFAGACSSPARQSEGGAEQSGATDAQSPSGAEQGTGIDAEWTRLSLAEQKKALLVDGHLQRASELQAALRLEEAELEVAKALELDADNLAAKQKMSELGALLGRAPGSSLTTSQELARQYELSVQQSRLEAEDSVNRGRQLLERREYDAAIAELTLALDHIRWAPYSLDWGGIDKQAQDLLTRARAEREQFVQADQEQQRKAAFEQLKAEERSELARRRAVIDNMLEQAVTAFERGRYEDAMTYAEKALAEDPRNEMALDLRDSSFRASRKQAAEDYRKTKLERYARWRQDMDEQRVPLSEVVTAPDAAYWEKITKLREERTDFEAKATASAAELELAQQLKTTRIPGLTIEDTDSLEVVISTLRTLTGLPLVVDAPASAAASDAGVTFNFNFQNSLTVEQALNQITKAAGEGVTWTIKHDAVLITTTEKARGELVIQNHSVQDLIFGLTDFQGPRIDRLRLVDDNTDEDGGGPFGKVDESRKIVEPDELANLVRDNVAVGTWDQDGVSITVEWGNMIVRHRVDVQRSVRQFLEDLRRFSSSMVTVESKFMTIEENWLQEIGVEFRGLDNPTSPFTDLDDITNGLEDNASLGLDNGGTGVNNTNASGPPSAGFFYGDGEDGDFKGATSNIFGSSLGSALSNIGGLTAQWTFLNDLQASMILRAVEKSSNAEIINDQVVSVYNTERAYVTVINQRAYVQDFDVEVATFEAIADPEINVLTEGIVLDVRPTISHDRKYITLEVQPTVAKVIALNDFSTALGGNTSPVSFQLPELEVKSVFTTAVVPDGGSILIGGLSRGRNIERRAEVPWLANIPVVGFFFKEEGYNDEKSGLMILLRAWITDVKEPLPEVSSRR